MLANQCVEEIDRYFWFGLLMLVAKIVSYADDMFGVLSIKEYLQLVCPLDDKPRRQFTECLKAVNQR